MSRRVVVTGMGAITPIGLSVEEFWKNVHDKKLGFGEITHFDASGYKAHLAAEVQDFIWNLRRQREWSCSASMR